MAKRFTLVGPHAGQTIKLGKYQFTNGVLVFPGSDKDAETLANILENFYSAYPDEKLEDAQARFEQALAESGMIRSAPAIVSEADDAAADAAEKARLEAEAKQKAETEAAEKAAAEKKAADEAAEAKAKAEAEEAAKKAAEDAAAAAALGEGGSGEPKTLAEVIQDLDPANEDHWSARGLPAVEAVSKLFGKDVSRADIEAAAPDYTRAAAKAAKANS